MIHTTDPPMNLNWYPLSDEEIRQFDNEGYLIVRNVLDPPTIDRLIEVSDQLMASDRRENRQLSHNELYDSFRNCIAIDDAFIPLLTHEKILSAVVQLLGAHIQLMTSHLIYKHPDPPGTPDTTRSPGWHRDYASATKVLGNFVPRILLKCAYYLTDLSEPNSGATLVVPGSNQLVKAIEIPLAPRSPAYNRVIVCCLKIASGTRGVRTYPVVLARVSYLDMDTGGSCRWTSVHNLKPC